MTRPTGLAVRAASIAAMGRSAAPRRAEAGSAGDVVPRVTHAAAWLTRWLLVAVAADLLVTRFVVRLAIFIPKGEPWAAISAWLGRVGAMVDTLVPILAVLVLASMLSAAGRMTRFDRALLVSVAAVAVLGIAGAYLAPAPLTAVIVDGLIVLVAVGAASRIARSSTHVDLAIVGSVALAAAVAAPAGTRLWDTVPLVLGASGGSWVVPLGTWISVGGQWAFVAGAAMLGLAGVRIRRSGWLRDRRSLVVLMLAALLAASLMLAFAWRAPASFGQLLIWSIGLTGAVPVAVIASAIALAVVGLPALHRGTPSLATGGSIVLLAGYGLSASGLVLASLLGLLITRSVYDHAHQGDQR
ncbi:MAG: hypothetical protein WEC14_06575 [Chloroflexota bacterium]